MCSRDARSRGRGLGIQLGAKFLGTTFTLFGRVPYSIIHRILGERALGQPLSFQDLSTRHPGVSTGLGSYMSEAARVCLDRHHNSPIELRIVSGELEAVTVAVAEWEVADQKTRAACANYDDTTEYGAYAICLAAVEVGHGLVAIQRAETRTGADFYIAEPGTPADDLEGWLRLEISGVDKGDVAAIKKRLREKVEQAKKGNSNLPALAAVVGFNLKQVAVSEKLTP